MNIKHALFGALLLLPLAQASAENHLKTSWRNFWLTPPQQGQRAFDLGEFEIAAKRYQDPMHIGSAYFRAGNFEAAAAAFGRVNSPEAMFNLGTTQVMQGQYQAAIDAFDQSLAARPDWEQAEQNRAIAQARLDSLNFDDLQRTDATEIGADDVVFDQSNKNDEQNKPDVASETQGVSDKALRALWLKKSQTSPSVFLKAKFSAQLAESNKIESDQ